jgi:hypothetical protein
MADTGRPTSYKPEYVQMLQEFFNVEAGIDVEVENSKGQMQSVRHAVDFPTLAGFACKIGVHRETLWGWSKEFPDFANAYKQAKEHQERILVQNGLKGGYQANFAIFTAKNVLDWRDKTETDLRGTLNIHDLTEEEIDRRIAQLAAIQTAES